jgi:transposase
MSDTELLPEPKREPEPVRRLEVFTGVGRRRRWTTEQKARIVAESYESGETVCAVARRHGLTPQQLFGWRRHTRLVEDGDGKGGICARDRGSSSAVRERTDCSGAPWQIISDRDRDRRCDGSDCARDRCRHVADGAARGDGGVMITVPAGIRVLVATKPVDFRKGGDGLAALVREALSEDPFSGTIFVFRSKRADRIKILAWDGSGLVLFWKRLEHGAFRWPPISDGIMRLTASQLAALVDGMDWSRLHARDVARPTATS